MTPPNVAVYNWIRQAFDFDGRATRSDYWWPRLLIITVNTVLLFMFVAAIGPEKSQILMDWLATGSNNLAELDMGPLPSLAKFSLTAAIVIAILTFIPDLSIAWRRFHDLGRPGWFHLIFMALGMFAPITALAELIWFAFPGTRGENRYGSDRLR